MDQFPEFAAEHSDAEVQFANIFDETAIKEPDIAIRCGAAPTDGAAAGDQAAAGDIGRRVAPELLAMGGGDGRRRR